MEIYSYNEHFFSANKQELEKFYDGKIDELKDFFNYLSNTNIPFSITLKNGIIFIKNNRWKYAVKKIQDIILMSEKLSKDSKLKLEYIYCDSQISDIYSNDEYIAIR